MDKGDVSMSEAAAQMERERKAKERQKEREEYEKGCITLENEDGGGGFLVLFSSDGADYIGIIRAGMHTLLRALPCAVAVDNPLRYMEQMAQNPQTRAVELQIGMVPVYNSLGSMEDMVFTISNVYYLKKKDQKLASSYAETLLKIRAKESDLVVPSIDDIRKVNS